MNLGRACHESKARRPAARASLAERGVGEALSLTVEFGPLRGGGADLCRAGPWLRRLHKPLVTAGQVIPVTATARHRCLPSTQTPGGGPCRTARPHIS